MASKTSSRVLLGPQQKAIGAHQPIKANDIKSLRSQDSKTNKTKVSQTNLNDSLTISDQASTITDIHVVRSSLETPIDQEKKKTSEPSSVKNSSASAKASDGIDTPAKTSGGAKISDRLESGNSSMCRESTSSDISDESTCSSFNKPHKANDARWEAI